MRAKPTVKMLTERSAQERLKIPPKPTQENVKNQKAPRCAELSEKYIYKSMRYKQNGGETGIRTPGRD